MNTSDIDDLKQLSNFELMQILYTAVGGADGFEEPMRTRFRMLYWELYDRVADE